MDDRPSTQAFDIDVPVTVVISPLSTQEGLVIKRHRIEGRCWKSQNQKGPVTSVLGGPLAMRAFH